MENFNALVKRAMQIGGRDRMRPVVEKELFHYDILFALDESGLLDRLTFQGGTCLRLCYGAPRFSEDLDFLGGAGFDASSMATLKGCLEDYLGRRYGLEISVKEPKEVAGEPEYRDIKVDTWRISIRTAPEAKDLPSQRLKIEIANLDALSRVPRSVVANYDFLPDGYGDTIVLAETLDEIMADKVVSLVNCRAYVRHRDIWDLHWLIKQGAKLNGGFVAQKVRQYHVGDYPKLVDDFRQRLPEIVHGRAFKEQMMRFLPVDVLDRTLHKEKFNDLLVNEVGDLLVRAVGCVEKQVEG